MGIDAQDAGIAGGPHPAGSLQASFPIVPDDDRVLDEKLRVIYIGVAGILHYEMINKDERTRNLAAGYHPLKVRRVFSTGTTASEIEGHY